MLSMNATNLPRVKSMIRHVESGQAIDLLNRVMTMDNPQIITSTVELAIKKMGQGKLVRPVDTAS